MTGKATLAACEWIRDNHPDHPRFVLSGAIDTDKKHSQINMLMTQRQARRRRGGDPATRCSGA